MLIVNLHTFRELNVRLCFTIYIYRTINFLSKDCLRPVVLIYKYTFDRKQNIFELISKDTSYVLNNYFQMHF